MALTLRFENDKELSKTFDKVQKALNCNTASKTIYTLIERHEPTQKEIMQLRATIEAQRATIEEQNNTLEVIHQFARIIQPQPPTNGKAKKKG